MPTSSEERKPSPDKRIISNSVTGESVNFVEYAHETNGTISRFLVDVLPGGGPPLHFHRTYAEHFTCIKGVLGLTLDGQEYNLNPGESKTVEIGQHHRFHNDTKDVVHFQVTVTPGHSGLEKGLCILFGLASSGYTNEFGVPYSMVDSAIVSQSGMTDTRFVGTKGQFINMLTVVFAWYGRLIGRQQELLEKFWY